MSPWQRRTSKYFYVIVGAVVVTTVLLVLADAYKSRRVRDSLTTYMSNLRDTIFMSTYDSLKKGNMKVFRSHLEEIGTFDDVLEFSLLDNHGLVLYSSDPDQVKQTDTKVVGLENQSEQVDNGITTYYFPVETISYCSRCHPGWKVGEVSSYYKLSLSRTALDAVKSSTIYYHVFTVIVGGVFTAFIYVLFTLYERRKHEEQMFLSASVFEKSVEAITITTFEGKIEKINSSFTLLTGYTEQDILGRDVHLLSAGEINRDAYRDMHRQIRKDGLWSGEMWNRNKNGATFPVRLSVTAVRNRQNRITHFISIFYDISSEKAAKRTLIEMDQMKSEFISTAAHELRTPLTAMLGFTEFVREPEKFGGFTAEQVNDFLDEVTDRGEALNQIIDDLLDVSRIEGGRPIELDRQDVCLVEVLSKVVEFHTAHDTGHVFRVDLPEKSELTRCRIDRYRINQVLENLLSNASKYSPRGTEIFLKCHGHKDVWEISVEDQGIGMTKEQVEQVFDKFYRADSSNTAVSGLGLGMSIARQIVVNHGGTVWVDSASGKGTKVYISLPKDPSTVE